LENSGSGDKVTDFCENECFSNDVNFEEHVAVCMGCGFPLTRSQIGCVIEGTMNDYYRKTDYPVTLTYCYECRDGLYQFGKESIETAETRLEKLRQMDLADGCKRGI
jgi:hypothetical protein